MSCHSCDLFQNKGMHEMVVTEADGLSGFALLHGDENGIDQVSTLFDRR